MLAGFGTRGDVQPMVALAQALSGRGHTCSVFVPPNIAGWVKSFGLDTTPVGMDYEKLSHAEARSIRSVSLNCKKSRKP